MQSKRIFMRFANQRPGAGVVAITAVGNEPGIMALIVRFQLVNGVAAT